jgi:hypothetical protein
MSINLLEVIPTELLGILAVACIYNKEHNFVFNLIKQFPTSRGSVLNFILGEDIKLKHHLIVVSQNIKRDYLDVFEELLYYIIDYFSYRQDNVYSKLETFADELEMFNIINFTESVYEYNVHSELEGLTDRLEIFNIMERTYQYNFLNVLKHLYFSMHLPRLYEYYLTELHQEYYFTTFFDTIVSLSDECDIINKDCDEDKVIKILELYDLDSEGMLSHISIFEHTLKYLEASGKHNKLVKFIIDSEIRIKLN